MALGRRNDERQGELWIATPSLPVSPGHAFYVKLNELLAEGGFDEWVEKLCEPYYAKRGRPSIPPGVYFRMLLVGYFEGIGSQRGIAWRCSDSLSLRKFLGMAPTEESPVHASLSVIRERLPTEEVHKAVFLWVLTLAREKKLLDGRTLGVDSTTLEANAAMKSIVRRDTEEDWQEYVTGLMRAEGVIEPDEKPTIDEIKRFDKTRPNKKVSNDEWKSPTDEDSRIAKMKDGRTHLAYKAEHAVDLSTEMIVAAEIYPADYGDTLTLEDHVGRHGADGADQSAGIGKRRADRRRGGRQRLSLGPGVGGLRRAHAVSDIRRRAGASRRPEARLDRQAGGATRRRVCQSPAHPRRTRQEAATATERESGTELCACVCDGRSATHVALGNREGLQALSDVGDGA